jgi:hypothetical protein
VKVVQVLRGYLELMARPAQPPPGAPLAKTPPPMLPESLLAKVNCLTPLVTQTGITSIRCPGEEARLGAEPSPLGGRYPFHFNFISIYHRKFSPDTIELPEVLHGLFFTQSNTVRLGQGFFHIAGQYLVREKTAERTVGLNNDLLRKALVLNFNISCLLIGCRNDSFVSGD